MAFAKTRDVEIKLINATGQQINVPKEGHRVKNPGTIDGWKALELGGAVNLAPGANRSVTQDLNIKAVDDAQVELHYSGNGDRDYVQVFTNLDIKNDRDFSLTLTHH